MIKKIFLVVAAFLILTVASITLVDSYDRAELYSIENSALSTRYSVASTLENDVSVRTLPYALKAEVLNTSDSFDVLMDVQCDDPIVLQRIKGVFGTYYGYWKSHIYEYKNVHSCIKDLNTGQIAGTHPELLNSSVNQLSYDYQIVLKLNYDENGKLQMETYDKVGFNWMQQFDESMKSEIEQYMSSEVNALLNDYSSDLFELSLKSITDMEIMIAVPLVLEEGDLLYNQGQPVLYYHFTRMLAVYAIMVSCCVFVLSLFMPIKVVKDVKWIRQLLDIKCEILLVLLALCIIPGAVLMLNIGYFSITGELAEIISQLNLPSSLGNLVVFVDYVVWFVYLSVVMFAALLVRWIFHKGLFVYLKENTCVSWFFANLKKLVQWLISLFDKMMSFDLKDSSNQFVIKAVGINLVAMILFCCFFPAGILFALIYSVAVFFYLKKKLGRIQSDYANVLYTTMMLSDGNFNVSIEEDAGLFNSLKRSLGTLKNGFQKAVNEEVKSQRMKSELITNVSHDLKTPLTSMITYVDLLKNCNDEQERKQYIDTLDRNSHRLKQLIEDLFEVSKAQSGNVALNLVEADLISLIRQVVLECEDRLLEKNLEFKLTSSEEKMLVQLDSGKAFRIFENLILNVCKYAMPSTRVFVDVHTDEKYVRVVIKNISEQEIAFDPNEITERFVQGDKSRNAHGSGLGLAIVKSFTELHHGLFHVETDGDLFKAIVEFPKS